MQKIIDNVYYIGSYDKERKIFDELMPLSEGTTYNSYVVKGDEKTAIVETVYFKKSDEYLKRLIDNNINVDYIIANHGEQDHTGAIGKVLEKFPNAIVVTNKKVADNIISMLNIPSEKIKLVDDGEELSLGNKTLRFKFAPFVHWPDTMFTYLVEDNILFTCDFLGAHNTTCDNIFADYSDNLINCAKKYYAEIMMPFRKFAAQYTDYVLELNPKMVLPSHGPVYDNPKFILDLYKKWTSDETEKLVVISYVSMYGSTKLMVDYLKELAEDKYSDEDVLNAKDKYSYCTPFTKESLMYRDIFESFFPQQGKWIKDFWMPNKEWENCDVDDPSARVLKNYGDSGK